MARFSGALTQGLMNPTYGNQLSQAAGLFGGLGGDLRKQQLMKQKADEMRQAPDQRAMLEIAVKQATTPQEIMAAQAALTDFDKQATTQQRQDLLFAQGQADIDRSRDKEVATSMLSAQGIKYNQAVAAGQPKAAEKILAGMENIAGKTGLNLQDFIDADAAPSAASRYLNIGGGKVFDTQTAKMIDGEGGEGAGGPELAPKDFLSNIRQQQKDEGTYTQESFQTFLSEIPKKGVYKAAESLTAVDLEKAEADISASVVADASRNLSAIDDLLAIAPDGGFVDAAQQMVFDWVPASEQKSVSNAVDTLKANVAFDRLQKMRDQSKTGGALGQVSEKELRLLEANLASLDPTSRDFKKNLETIRRTYERVIDIEQGPEGGSPNYKTGPDGTVFYRDPTTGLVYNYNTGKVIPR